MLNVTGERECCVSSVGIVKSKSNGVTSSVEGLLKLPTKSPTRFPNASGNGLTSLIL